MRFSFAQFVCRENRTMQQCFLTERYCYTWNFQPLSGSPKKKRFSRMLDETPEKSKTQKKFISSPLHQIYVLNQIRI